MVSPAVTVTVSPAETGDKICELAADRACAVTVYVPGPGQLWEALEVPTGSHPEIDPSPQDSSYRTWFPALDTAPPAEYVLAVPVNAAAGPTGADGAEMVSPAMVTTSPGETLDKSVESTAERACAVTV